MFKISEEQYRDWRDKYLTEDVLKKVRVGQSFCNFFSLADRNLFYMEDDAKALVIVRGMIDE